MRSGFSKLRLLAVALVTTVAISATALGIENATEEQDPTVYAEFVDASPLIVGNDVRLNGVSVGRVSSMGVRDGVARVGLNLGTGALPLHTDARFTIRPVGLLGERFVALERGTPSAPVVPLGGTIPTSQTGKATDLDEVLDAVDRPTGTALAALVTSLGEGVRGHGGELDDAVAALAPAMQSTTRLASILRDQNTVLTRLIDSVEPVTGALAAERGRQLNRLVRTSDQILDVTASRQRSIDATLGALPGVLSDARGSLRQLSGAARTTTPTLAALRPTTDRLGRLSVELRRFARSADPALASVRPVLDQARRMIHEARPVVAVLHQTGPDLSATARNARPVAVRLMDNLTNVLEFVKGWALTTNGTDGLAHYFRAHAVATHDAATGTLQARSGAPEGGKLVEPRVPEVPLPDLRPPKAPLPQLDPEGPLPRDVDPGRRPPDTKMPKRQPLPEGTEPGSVTGLSMHQERRLLGYLVGGVS